MIAKGVASRESTGKKARCKYRITLLSPPFAASEALVKFETITNFKKTSYYFLFS